jgi:putative ABC transport system permease protein
MQLRLLAYDLRSALRALRRSPGFVLVAVLSLAIGIGANSTLFTMVDAVRYRPLPYERSGELVDLHEDNPAELCAGCGVGTSFATYADWVPSLRSYQTLAAYTGDLFSVAGAELPVRVRGARISASLLPTLGVRVARGRAFTAEDDRIGGPAVALLGHALWLRQFGGDPAVVGRTIRVNGVQHEVVGVLPEGFAFPDAELWVPLFTTAPGTDRADRTLGVLGRLREGVSVEQADAELRTVMAGIAAQHSETLKGWEGRVTTLRASLMNDAGPPFDVLLGAAALVLLLACANLANLSLARAAAREREFAVRAALGASRGRAMRQLLCESVLVSLAGGGLAIVIATWIVGVAPRFLPDEMPRWVHFAVDWRVLAFTFLVAVTTGLLFGLAPALRMGGLDLHDTLKEGAKQSSGGRRGRRLQRWFVVAQVALALIVLTGAGLLFKTFLRVSSTDQLGYDPREVLSARAELLDRRYEDTAQVAAFGSAVMARLEAAPGVRGVALESSRFLGTFVGHEGRLTIEGSPTAVPDAIVPRFALAVTPRYFELKGLRIDRGRGFSEQDVAGSDGVVVINDATAEALWPGQDVIGKRLKLGDPSAALPWLTVIGIVSNSSEARFARTPSRLLYASYAQDPGHPTIFVRTTGDAGALAATVRAAVAQVDRDQPLTDVGTMAEHLRDYVAPVTLFARLVGAMAVFALLLAALGTYGLVAHLVTQRTQEFGIRLALGATPRRILVLVLEHGAWLAITGVIVGLAGALALTRVMRAILFGTDPTDPVVLASVSVLLIVSALVACLLPARRATAVSPSQVLRAD